MLRQPLAGALYPDMSVFVREVVTVYLYTCIEVVKVYLYTCIDVAKVYLYTWIEVVDIYLFGRRWYLYRCDVPVSVWRLYNLCNLV